MKPKFLTNCKINTIPGCEIQGRRSILVLNSPIWLFFSSITSAKGIVKLNTGGIPVIFKKGLLVSSSTASAVLEKKAAHNFHAIDNNFYSIYPFLQNIV